MAQVIQPSMMSMSAPQTPYPQQLPTAMDRFIQRLYMLAQLAQIGSGIWSSVENVGMMEERGKTEKTQAEARKTEAETGKRGQQMSEYDYMSRGTTPEELYSILVARGIPPEQARPMAYTLHQQALGQELRQQVERTRKQQDNPLSASSPSGGYTFDLISAQPGALFGQPESVEALRKAFQGL